VRVTPPTRADGDVSAEEDKGGDAGSEDGDHCCDSATPVVESFVLDRLSTRRCVMLSVGA